MSYSNNKIDGALMIAFSVLGILLAILTLSEAIDVIIVNKYVPNVPVIVSTIIKIVYCFIMVALNRLFMHLSISLFNRGMQVIRSKE